MSDEEVFAPTIGVEDDHVDTKLSLFDGDDGGLTLDQRRCLIVVLKHPIITDDRAEWATLVRDSRIIKSRLNDLFLDLVIDRERGIAYKVQIRSGEVGYVPPLLRDAAFTREETVLLVVLRQRHLAAKGSGLPRAHVDREELLAGIDMFRPARSTDRVGEAKRAASAVDSLARAGILVKAGSDDRFLISEVIERLLSIDKLYELLAWLKAQNAPGTPRDDEGPEASVAFDDEEDAE
ncbi:hypothetical protein GCM10010922_11870 [Microbacterium sorbitolivorans]|uniref:DUF4194 domain-containing protein n=1 Tax=Microbacterium sorbitolivorans TaxID=1867410 RepID=A0A367XYC4_9MICO|nr:DUF4194 domain-containing protein [Microbacterium sorbitolivorans]RCK58645.1 DUF4194 domain-containing protein [Microbacterium sorbitolivorans]GGF38166.1 hypothetical protein GCM10010922_11870 [Microbacterium sorbitolivorans]